MMILQAIIKLIKVESMRELQVEESLHMYIRNDTSGINMKKEDGG